MNVEELNTQLEYLDETKSLIKQAIIDKGQSISENDTFRNFVQKINDIETGIETVNVPIWFSTGSTGATEIFEYAVANKIQLNSVMQPNHWTRLDTNSTTRTEPLVDDFVVMYGGFNEGEYIYLSQIVEIAEHTAEEQIYACKITPIFGTLKTTLAEKLNISSNVLKAGTTILDVSGKSTIVDTEYTGSYTTTENDLLQPYTAFINGQEIHGNVSDLRKLSGAALGNSIAIHSHVQYDSVNNNIVEHTYSSFGSQNVAISKGVEMDITIPGSSVAEGIGLTADKIKQGETILGIAGTYAGATMKEYASETAMNNDIANIQEGEVVKVVADGTTTHYIKETTMKKLVKEVDTISPQEYEENVILVDDILGEGATK